MLDWTKGGIGPMRPFESVAAASSRPGSNRKRLLLETATVCPLVLLLAAGSAMAQVITIDKEGRPENGNHAATVDRRFAQIQPTNVPLTKSILDAKTRLELIRLLQAEQGFAMRPFPKGHRGLTLAANGKLEPAGEAYLNMVTTEGLC